MSKQAVIVNNKVVTVDGDAVSLQNLTPENIKNGVNIGGVVGTYQGSTQVIKRTKWVSNNSSSSVRVFEIDNLPSEPIMFIIDNQATWNARVNFVSRVPNQRFSAPIFHAVSGSTFFNTATTIMSYSYSNGKITLTASTDGVYIFAGTYDIICVCQ